MTAVPQYLQTGHFHRGPGARDWIVRYHRTHRGRREVLEELVDDSGGYSMSALQFWSSDDEFAGHYRRYNRRTLGRVLTDAGFEILLFSHFFSLLVPMLFLVRTPPRALGRRKVRTMDEATRTS